MKQKHLSLLWLALSLGSLYNAIVEDSVESLVTFWGALIIFHIYLDKDERES